jgi:hypothetical protein
MTLAEYIAGLIAAIGVAVATSSRHRNLVGTPAGYVKQPGRLGRSLPAADLQGRRYCLVFHNRRVAAGARRAREAHP